MLSDRTLQQIRDAYARLSEEKSLSPRSGQRRMIADVAAALGRTDDAQRGAAVAVIEASPGTGKTIAYAMAAIPAALELEKKLILATATVALQEQLVYKDLPDIREHSGLSFDFRLAKGRRRYVCLSRLEKLLAGKQEDQPPLPLYPDEISPPLSAEALPVYTSMAAALAAGEWDGDRDSWPRSIDENIWFSTTSDRNQCSANRCPNYRQCSFYRARSALHEAQVIVTNHDLVLSDLVLGGGVVLPAPEDSIYVFDEGHHLPDKALGHFAAFTSLAASQQWLEEIGRQLARAGRELRDIPGLLGNVEPLPGLLQEIIAGLRQVQRVLDDLIDANQLSERGDQQHYRLPQGKVPEPLRSPSRDLSELFSVLQGRLGKLEEHLQEVLEAGHESVEETAADAWYGVIGAMLSRTRDSLNLWRDYAHGGDDEDPPTARWVELRSRAGRPGFNLRSSPILAAGLLQEHLWQRAAGVIVTSATLQVMNSFDRFLQRSGAPPEAVFRVVAGPFDFSKAVLSIPAMTADPGKPAAHTDALIGLLPQLLAEGEGSLVLFSSRRQMQEVYGSLAAPWSERVLVQGHFSKQEILRRHRRAVDSGEASVIFGLASYAEGVDLPGRYCNHVIIAKIPFAVPDDPLESALAEWLQGQGRNPFMEIAMPDAALRLKQACGRLLRTETDTGRVSLLDRRLVTRRYGAALLDSLPRFRREIG